MPERTHSRRSILFAGAVIPTAALVAGIAPDSLISMEYNLSKYKAGTIAHNAAIHPLTLSRAIASGVGHVEVDITLDDNGIPIVGHDPESVRLLSPSQKERQHPGVVIPQILDSGKSVFLDLKRNVGVDHLDETLDMLKNDPASMASSNSHDLLDQLRESHRFGGKILYSIGNSRARDAFFDKNKGKNFRNEHKGVSIRHKLLKDDVPEKLLAMGLEVAAWCPNKPVDIANALKANVSYITSDEFSLLGTIGRIEPIVTNVGPQQPLAG